MDGGRRQDKLCWAKRMPVCCPWLLALCVAIFQLGTARAGRAHGAKRAMTVASASELGYALLVTKPVPQHIMIVQNIDFDAAEVRDTGFPIWHTVQSIQARVRTCDTQIFAGEVGLCVNAALCIAAFLLLQPCCRPFPAGTVDFSLHASASVRACEHSCTSAVQGNCTASPPSLSDGPPLLPLAPGQCVVMVSGTAFYTRIDTGGQNLLLSNLYFRIKPGSVGSSDGASVLRLSDTAQLWMEDVTIQGNFRSDRPSEFGSGIYGSKDAARVFMSGACAPQCEGAGRVGERRRAAMSHHGSILNAYHA
jgi:hypothetical protein